MRECGPYLENKQSEHAGAGSACHSKMILMGITLGLLCVGITLSLSGCGSSDSVPPLTPIGPGISITSPTTDPTFSQVCSSELLLGSMGLGTSAKFSPVTVKGEELTGVRVTWMNAATGVSGQARQNAFSCTIFDIPLICDLTWGNIIPLVLGDNRITVTATDTATGGASTATITIKKPILTFTVSGSFLSHLGIPPGFTNSTLDITGVGTNGSHFDNIVEPTGSYALSCVPDGIYTLTPSSTINYNFSPANRSVIVDGADVPEQNFTAPAFLVSGSVTLANNGGGFESQGITLSGSSSVATAVTASDGSYSFLVPNGTYTLTPAPQTTPPSRTVTVNNTDMPAQDFVQF